MTTATAPASPSAPRTVASRPVWARYGGLGLLLGGALLLVATIVEYVFSGEAADPLAPLFSVLFLVAVAVQCLAMLPFALGSTGADGVTGARPVGKWALLVFGAIYLHNQLDYFTSAYGPQPGTPNFDVTWMTYAGAAVQLIALVTASVAIVRAGVATGAAKWAFPAITAVATVAGIVANAAESNEVVVIALISSCVTQIVAGAAILAQRSR